MPFFYYLCTRNPGRWCNGNTTGFGSVIPGSNPSRPTESKQRLSFFLSLLFYFKPYAC